MTPVDVCNLALSEIGQRVIIASFSDKAPAAAAAALHYTPRVQMLLRSAQWDFARATIILTQWKAALIDGATSSNPPAQPFAYAYLYPPDCLKARFIMPTIAVEPPGVPLTTASTPAARFGRALTRAPFVVGADVSANAAGASPVKIIQTNLPKAQLVYTRDLSQTPDMWDSLFLSAATALLGAYFLNALARNKAQYDDQVAMSKSLIDQARVANGNEDISSIDMMPDWLRVRRSGGWSGSDGAWGGSLYEPVVYPGGLSY